MYIKKFIDRVSLMESRRSKDVVMTIEDARGLRDELAKLLLDLIEANKATPEIISVEITGGGFV